MIRLEGDKDVEGITMLGHVVSEVRQGSRLVWQSVRSCFGSGAWQNDKPWMNDEGWKN